MKIQDIKNLVVTDYSKGLFKEPILNVEFFKNARLKIDDLNELEVNECIWYHIFDRLPMMRDIPANKDWFEGYIISKL